MPFILLILLLTVGIVLTDVLAYAPLALLQWLHLPQWLGLGAVGVAIAWIIGDD
ncbi:MAG: hypothetical protein AB4042_11920 [Leptolyngbyaceae cyanobacterium]